MRKSASSTFRVTKPSTRRSSSSSSLSLFGVSKSSSSPRRPSKNQNVEYLLHDRLEDHGVLSSLATDLRFSDVAQLLRYVHARMFAPVPESGSGMNSVRIAEVLNFRVSLPPIVTVAHVHALSHQPTRVEREIAELIEAGLVRRLVFAGRGKDTEGVGEGLVLVEEWQKLVRSHPDLGQELKDKYCQSLADPRHPRSFKPDEISLLLRTGFFTRVAHVASTADLYLQPGMSTLGSLASVTSAGSTYSSGTAEAAAQGSREHISGNIASTDRRSDSAQAVAARASEQFNFALPNTGPFLKLVTAARSHLVTLLKNNSKFKELPQDLLRERWDGGILGQDQASRAAKARGEFRGILPGKTRKWKQFSGLEPQWVIEECLGAGLIECFKTGAVGVGIRAL